jgi:hypothetical protein
MVDRKYREDKGPGTFKDRPTMTDFLHLVQFPLPPKIVPPAGDKAFST